MSTNTCACGSAPTLIFACSGAADVGAVADQAAREMTRNGAGSMFCLAGIGGRVPGIMKTTEAAGDILAIDGCPINCVKKCLEEAGFDTFKHLRLADLGLKKGETEVNDSTVKAVARHGAELLGDTCS